MTPSFQESHISQIPAIQLLQRVGYQFLTPEDVALERSGKTTGVLMRNILRQQLKRLNQFEYGGETHAFSDDSIAKAIELLDDVPYQGLVRSSEKVYDLLTLGESFSEKIGDRELSPQLRYIDWARPHNNVFHVAAEFAVARSGSQDRCVPDIVCFVNGIPFVVIECKRPEDKDAIGQAISQQIRNQKDDHIPRLFTYAQLLLAVNKNDGRYATTGTGREFWAKWKERRDESAELKSLVSSAGPRAEHEKLFSGRFAYAQDFFEDLIVSGREPTAQDQALYSLCRPERLIELARQFIVYDDGGATKKIARYQQYFTVKETLKRVQLRDQSDRRRGGVIWHTQGSGKSLTMVMLGKALALDTEINNPRILLVTDRIDLDDQIWKTFRQCGKNAIKAKTGAHLMELIQDGTVEIITTVLDKFRAAAKGYRDQPCLDTNLFVLVDESHRSQYGQANIKMQQALPKACFIGFTGTPLMKEEKNTARRFGGYIEPAYTIRDAVSDQAVVPIYYEGRHVMQEVNQKAVDRMFESLSEGLSDDQRADLKRKFASRDELNKLESKLYLIAWDVSEHFSKNWQGTDFKAQLTAPNKESAIRLAELIQEFGKISCEVLISAPDDREGNEDTESAGSEKVQAFWNKMMKRYGTEKAYNEQIITSFKHGEQPELLIVVDKLLTGFDAPRNRTLYIARSLKEHTLLQAIARVNRLHPGKDYGQVVDYYGVVTHLHEALELYSSLEGKFDEEDIDGALFDVEEQLKLLPAAHDALWNVFKDVPNKRDEEAYEVALADEEKRDVFYEKLSKFSRLLKLALATLSWTRDTPPERIDRYKDSLRFFQSLRASVRIRYAEEVDYREYEKQIKKMLSTYVQSDEIMQVNEPVNIFNRREFQEQVDKARSPRAKADMIASRTKKTITEYMEEDPFFFRKFSRLLQDVIDDYRQQRIDEMRYLEGVTEIMEAIQERRDEDTPEELAANDFGRALYRLVINGAKQGNCALSKSDAVKYALAIENAIARNRKVRWWENQDIQNKMRNDIDDVLYKMNGENNCNLTLDQMDEIVEGALQIARARKNDA